MSCVLRRRYCAQEKKNDTIHWKANIKKKKKNVKLAESLNSWKQLNALLIFIHQDIHLGIQTQNNSIQQSAYLKL